LLIVGNQPVLSNKRILITGGTGSFGRKCARFILENYDPQKLIIFSRDELKQYEMAQEFPSGDYPISYFIGDVTDSERVYRALDGVDYVIHAAAMKQVPASERNPFEAIKTNILGAQNIINASIDRDVKKVIALSTDKAVNPVNLYGATKLCSEKLFVAGNSYSGSHKARFSVVRYGNVMGSRGSVIPLFFDRRSTGILPITDLRMTRFWITLDQGIRLVMSALADMQGGEVFVPKIPSMSIVDLAKAIAPECEFDIIGLRPGEKVHEVLISETEAYYTKEYNDYYIITPQYKWSTDDKSIAEEGKVVPDGFQYTSDSNECWFTIEEMKNAVVGFE
jgi:UDP-N-acetylglucosamine 4,6-dehydratase/5-epimerase